MEDSTDTRKFFKWALWSLVVILAVWLFFASTVTIGTGKIAVMTRFGHVTGQELGEGFHVKMPLDHANTYDIKVLKEQTEAASASHDLQDVHATIVVNYRLEAGKISQIHQTIGKQYKDVLIDPAIQEVFKSASAKFDATELITNRQEIKKEAFEQLVDRLKRYGIIVQDLSITNFSFSPEFASSIEAKQVAAQQAEQAKYNVEKARNNADAAVATATGQAQAQAILRENLTTAILQKQAIDKWDGKLPTYMGGGAVFNIPLQ